jgi:predicted  nucleic acid-binding Zn-ribbon protein
VSNNNLDFHVNLIADKATRAAKRLQSSLAGFDRTYTANIRLVLNDKVTKTLQALQNRWRNRKLEVDIDTTKAQKSVQKLSETIGGVWATKDAEKWYQKVYGFFSSLLKVGTKVADGIATSFLAIGATIQAVIVAATIGLAKKMVDVNAQMEQYKVSLQTTLGGLTKAKETMAEIVQFAKKTPYTIQQVTDAVSRLASYQMDMKTWLEPLGNAASAFGRDITDAVEMAADAMMGLFRRAQSYGIKGELIQKMAKEQGITYADALLKVLNERFAGGMELQSATFKGTWSNLKDTFTINFQKATAPAFEKIKKMMADFYASINPDDKAHFNEALYNRISTFFKKLGDTVISAASIVKKFISYFSANILPTLLQVGAAASEVWKEFKDVMGSIAKETLVPVAITFLQILKVVLELVAQSKLLIEIYIGFRAVTKIFSILGVSMKGLALSTGAAAAQTSAFGTALGKASARLTSMVALMGMLWAAGNFQEVKNNIEELGGAFDAVAFGAKNVKAYLTAIGEKNGFGIKDMTKAANVAKQYGVNMKNALEIGAQAAASENLNLDVSRATELVGALAKAFIHTGDSAAEMRRKTYLAQGLLITIQKTAEETGISFENFTSNIEQYGDVLGLFGNDVVGLKNLIVAFGKAAKEAGQEGADVGMLFSKIQDLMAPTKEMIMSMPANTWIGRTTDDLREMAAALKETDPTQAAKYVESATRIDELLEKWGNKNGPITNAMDKAVSSSEKVKVNLKEAADALGQYVEYFPKGGLNMVAKAESATSDVKGLTVAALGTISFALLAGMLRKGALNMIQKKMVASGGEGKGLLKFLNQRQNYKALPKDMLERITANFGTELNKLNTQRAKELNVKNLGFEEAAQINSKFNAEVKNLRIRLSSLAYEVEHARLPNSMLDASKAVINYTNNLKKAGVNLTKAATEWVKGGKLAMGGIFSVPLFGPGMRRVNQAMTGGGSVASRIATGSAGVTQLSAGVNSIQKGKVVDRLANILYDRIIVRGRNKVTGMLTGRGRMGAEAVGSEEKLGVYIKEILKANKNMSEYLAASIKEGLKLSSEDIKNSWSIYSQKQRVKLQGAGIGEFGKYSQFMPETIMKQITLKGGKLTKEISYVFDKLLENQVTFGRVIEQQGWNYNKATKIIDVPMKGVDALGTKSGMIKYFHELGHAIDNLSDDFKDYGKTFNRTMSIEVSGWKTGIRTLKQLGIDLPSNMNKIVSYSLSTYVDKLRSAGSLRGKSTKVIPDEEITSIVKKFVNKVFGVNAGQFKPGNATAFTAETAPKLYGPTKTAAESAKVFAESIFPPEIIGKSAKESAAVLEKLALSGEKVVSTFKNIEINAMGVPKVAPLSAGAKGLNAATGLAFVNAIDTVIKQLAPSIAKYSPLQGTTKKVANVGEAGLNAAAMAPNFMKMLMPSISSSTSALGAVATVAVTGAFNRITDAFSEGAQNYGNTSEGVLATTWFNTKKAMKSFGKAAIDTGNQVLTSVHDLFADSWAEQAAKSTINSFGGQMVDVEGVQKDLGEVLASMEAAAEQARTIEEREAKYAEIHNIKVAMRRQKAMENPNGTSYGIAQNRAFLTDTFIAAAKKQNAELVSDGKVSAKLLAMEWGAREQEIVTAVTNGMTHAGDITIEEAKKMADALHIEIDFDTSGATDQLAAIIEAQESLRNMQDAYKATERAVELLEASLKPLQAELDALNKKIEENEKSIKKWEEAMSSATDQLSLVQAQSEMALYTDEVINAKRAIMELNNTLADQEDSLRPLEAALDKAKRAYSDIEKELSGVQEQLDRLMNAPLSGSMDYLDKSQSIDRKIAKKQAEIAAFEAEHSRGISKGINYKQLTLMERDLADLEAKKKLLDANRTNSTMTAEQARERAALQEQINKYGGEVSTAEIGKLNVLLDQQKALEAQLKSAQAQIDIAQAAVDAKQAEIEQTKDLIANQEAIVAAVERQVEAEQFNAKMLADKLGNMKQIADLESQITDEQMAQAAIAAAKAGPGTPEWDNMLNAYSKATAGRNKDVETGRDLTTQAETKTKEIAILQTAIDNTKLKLEGIAGDMDKIANDFPELIKGINTDSNGVSAVMKSIFGTNYSSQVQQMVVALNEMAGTAGKVVGTDTSGNYIIGQGLQEFAEGGISKAKKTGSLALLHNEEAVIPLSKGSVPVKITGIPSKSEGVTYNNNAKFGNFSFVVRNDDDINEIKGVINTLIEVVTSPTSFKDKPHHYSDRG